MRALILKFPARLLLHALKFVMPRLNDLERENLFLRYQLLVLQREVKRIRLERDDRKIMHTFSQFYSSWRRACILVRPETVLKWHREFAKMFWSQSLGGRPPIAPEIKSAVFRMKKENRFWGPARIHGELLKLGIKVSESTVRNILRNAPKTGNPNQGLSWKVFLGRHKHVWAMDLFTVHSATFKTLHVLVIMNIHTREIISLRASDGMPKGQWVSNILKHEIAEHSDKHTPSLIVHDRDRKFRASEVQNVIKSSGIRPVKTPFRAPLANSFVERLNGTLQRECTDHFLFFNARQLERTLQEYKKYYNLHRPHQGIDQKIPSTDLGMRSKAFECEPDQLENELGSLRFLYGLRHSYYRKAA